VSRYDASLNLSSVLDQLREAYGLAKEAGHTELQDRLMTVRRQLTEVVNQNLSLQTALDRVTMKATGKHRGLALEARAPRQ